jgi:hypothetical protein
MNHDNVSLPLSVLASASVPGHAHHQTDWMRTNNETMFPCCADFKPYVVNYYRVVVHLIVELHPISTCKQQLPQIHLIILHSIRLITPNLQTTWTTTPNITVSRMSCLQYVKAPDITENDS